jgi:hypothetical protein
VNSGKLHRSDGPAIENSHSIRWWVYGRRHHASGSHEWWYNDIQESREKNRARSLSNLSTIRRWLPIESSGTLNFPLVDLIMTYLYHF